MMSSPNPQRPLTVVQIVPDMEGGGVERGTVEIAEGLVKQGHRSMVISGGGRLVDELKSVGSEHLQWSVGKKSLATLKWILPLRKLMQRESVDILHARSRVPAWLCWMVLKTMPKKQRPQFFTTAHGLNSPGQYSAIMTAGDAVIAVSQTVQNYLKHHYPKLNDDKVHVIYRGRDPKAFPFQYKPNETWQTQWDLDFPQLAGRTILTLPGRLTRLKGHHDFLKLMTRLKEETRNIHGLIVGGEDPRRKAYAEEIQQQIMTLGLSDTVTLTGHRSDIREIYAISNIVLSLSTKPESFGRTALESLSMGVPVLGYNHGGIGEILETVFPQGAVKLSDAEQLLEKTKHLLDNADARFVPEFEEFQLSTMIEKTLALYCEYAG